MKSIAISDPKVLAGTAKPSSLDGLGRRLVLSRLEGLARGRLVVRDDAEEFTFGQTAEEAELSVEVAVHDRRFYGDIAFGGSSTRTLPCSKAPSRSWSGSAASSI